MNSSPSVPPLGTSFCLYLSAFTLIKTLMILLGGMQRSLNHRNNKHLSDQDHAEAVKLSLARKVTRQGLFPCWLLKMTWRDALSK